MPLNGKRLPDLPGVVQTLEKNKNLQSAAGPFTESKPGRAARSFLWGIPYHRRGIGTVKNHLEHGPRCALDPGRE